MGKLPTWQQVRLGLIAFGLILLALAFAIRGVTNVTRELVLLVYAVRDLWSAIEVVAGLAS